ncbi:hypothetical protein M758_12G057700 [Ceratodon purpureus]|nr:hypothetical protein M758_12G057700 [Ceratodon purpureus]
MISMLVFSAWNLGSILQSESQGIICACDGFLVFYDLDKTSCPVDFGAWLVGAEDYATCQARKGRELRYTSRSVVRRCV